MPDVAGSFSNMPKSANIAKLRQSPEWVALLGKCCSEVCRRLERISQNGGNRFADEKRKAFLQLEVPGGLFLRANDKDQSDRLT